MTECPIYHHKWDKETETYVKARKEVIREMIRFLREKEGGANEK